MIYKLQEKDYLGLYGFAKAEDIKDLFGERSYSPNHIRKIWRKYSLKRLNTNLEEFMRDDVPADPLESKLAQKERLKEELRLKGQKKIEDLWNKINEHESRNINIIA